MKVYAISDFFEGFTPDYRFDDKVKYGKNHVKFGIFGTQEYTDNFSTILLPRIEKSNSDLYPSETSLRQLYSALDETVYTGSIITRCVKALIILRSEYLNKQRYLIARILLSRLFDVNPSTDYLDWRFGLYKEKETEPQNSYNIVHVMNMLKEFKYPDEGKFSTVGVTDDPDLDSYYYARKTPNLDIFKLPLDLKVFKWLLRHGYPIYCAIVLFESAKSKENYMFGTFSYPDVKNVGTHEECITIGGEKIIGSHPILITGYNQDRKIFNILNLISKEWGQNFEGTISYDYIMKKDLCGDIWTLSYTGYNY